MKNMIIFIFFFFLISCEEPEYTLGYPDPDRPCWIPKQIIELRDSIYMKDFIIEDNAIAQ